MPFEVFSIKSQDTSLPESEHLRTIQTVADEVAGIYEKVAEAGGQIIAGHHITYDGGAVYARKVDFLLLVAEYPEEN